MVTNTSRPFWGMVAGLWPRMLPIAAYIVIIAGLDLQFHFEDFHFPLGVVTVMGTVIGLLLAFRTNSSYGRWWEARILWGAIVNDSRSWTRQTLEFPKAATDQQTLQQMVYRQAAWCYALARNLRGQDPLQDIEQLLPPDEIESFQSSRNVPNSILHRQGREIRKLLDEDRLELFQAIQLEQTLVSLTNSMGGCERIKNTPFPASYSRMVHGMIYIFVLFLPFGLVDVPPPGLIATSVVLAYGFLLIERVALYLQDPFNNQPSDTPMLALSRTIEINLRQMLGETDLPEPMKSVRGILY